jgi:hypothetical protein
VASERARSHRGLYWAAVLLSLVLVVAGGIVAYLGYTATSGPDGAVKGYFAALQRGDAGSALAFGDIPPGPHTLLTGTVLKEQQRIAPIKSVQVVSVQHDGSSRATVTVHYDLDFPDGAQRITDEVPVIKDGSSWDLVRTAIPTQIELTHALERATIAGAGIPAGLTLLFPGALPITFDTPYLQLGAGVVTFATRSQVDATVEVSPAGRTAVADAVSSALRRCVSSGGRGYCPLPSDRYVPGSLEGRLLAGVAERMTLAVDPAAAGVIDIGGTVPFRGRYGKLDFDNVPSTRYGTIALPLTATVYAVQPVTVQWAAAQ